MHQRSTRRKNVKTCPICEKGKLEYVNDIIQAIGTMQFIMNGERCTHCKEEVVAQGEWNKIINVLRKQGLWTTPLRLHRQLSRSGRGIVLRIPTDIEHSLNIKGNEGITLSLTGKNDILVHIER